MTFLLASAGLTAKFVELLRVAEGKVSEVLTHRAREVVRQSAPHDWTPETPVYSTGAPSQYVLSLLDFIKARLPEQPKQPYFTSWTQPPANFIYSDARHAACVSLSTNEDKVTQGNQA